MAEWKKVFNPIISAIADPLLRKAAQRFAESVSEDSWLRTDIAERILAAIKGLAESYKGSGVSGIFIEKATDFLDFSSSSLFKKTGDDFSSVAKQWIDNFWVEAQRSLSTSSVEKLDEVKDRILKDFQIRQEIFRVICEAQQQLRPQKSKPNPIDWVALDNRVAQLLEENRPSWIKRRPKPNKGGLQ